MGIKTVLILILFIALGIFLLTTESGKKYLTFLQGKLKEFTEAAPVITPSKAFITLSIPQKELKDKTFTITNSTFLGYGIYKEIYAEKMRIEKRGEVEVSINIERGRVTLNFTDKEKSLRIFAFKTKSFRLGDFQLIPETPVETSIVIEPINFTLSNIQEESIIFAGMSGELRGTKGTVIVLDNKNVEIHQFIGDLIYVNQTASLSGSITKALINGNDITNIVV
ncbi:MAG: hypothetical protein QMD14_03340 [Candidatus Aenigmarchaeota archaeon]|nr:hypothetical protein [Candidatus Aenigmarchaeota archaeon]